VAPTPNGGPRRDGKRAFGESRGRLSAHVRREDPVKLSAKAASPVGRQRVTFAESTLGEGFGEWERAFAERILLVLELHLQSTPQPEATPLEQIHSAGRDVPLFQTPDFPCQELVCSQDFPCTTTTLLGNSER
jgi:hypothetical protein